MAKNLFRTEDIVAKVAELRGVSKVKAREEYDGVIDALKELIKDESHDGVAVHGLVTFEVVHKEARDARNPKTGETVKVEEKDVLKAKVTPSAKKLEF